MDSDAVVNPAVVRKIDGSFSRIYLRFNTGKLLCDLVNEETLLYFFLNAVLTVRSQFPSKWQLMHHSWDRYVFDAFDNWRLTSRVLLSFCTLPDTSFFFWRFIILFRRNGMKGKRRPKKCFCGALIILIRKSVPVRRLVVWKTASGSWSGETMSAGGRVILVIGAMIMPAWRHGRITSGHLKEYRKSHPEYVRKCREAQKRRDRSKRLHLDIQDKIKRQAPDIIDQLLDKAHLGNLDKQAKTGINHWKQHYF